MSASSLGKLIPQMQRLAQWVTAWLLLLAPAQCELLAADKSVQFNLLELPSSRVAQAALQAPDHFFCEQTEIRSCLRDLSQVHKITIWLDRQIDPGHLITTGKASETTKLTLSDRLKQIAESTGGEVGLIENVVYIGPAGRVERLQRAAVELHDAISRASDSSATLRGFAWSELSTSQENLEQLQTQWRVRIEGELAHDLFHEGKFWHPSTLATQLTVLLGGFEREVQLVQRNLFRIQPLAERGTWQGHYAKSELDLRRLRELTAQYAGSRCQTRNNISQVVGVTDFHLALLAGPPPGAAPKVNVNLQVWERAEIKNKKVEEVLTTLVGSVGYQLAWSDACTAEMRNQLIGFALEKATFDQLLAEVARVSGLKISRTGTTVSVSP